jgi:D-aminopeptidase
MINTARRTELLWSLLLCGLLVCRADAERPRAREIGIRIGTLETGKYNAITDVSGVQVGHVTLNWGSGPLVVGKGPVRTGVTAVLPHGDDIYLNQVFASAVVLNGNGEMTGVEWVNERGLLEVPIILTNTLSLGEAYSGVIQYMLKQNIKRVPLPVVAECYDGGLNDIAGQHVRPEHVIQAIESSMGGPVAEGSVGAGTGMRAYSYKAGIGTSSRILPEEDGGYTVGVLVNANCGRRPELLVAGVPVGKLLAEQEETQQTRDGSIIILIATDAPLIPLQLRRLCTRASLGLARTGTVSRTSSGDLILAFSVAHRITREDSVVDTLVADSGSELPLPQEPQVVVPVPIDTVRTLRDYALTPLFQATVEATEEAILNALCRADTLIGKDDLVMPGLPLDQVAKILKDHGKL